MWQIGRLQFTICFCMSNSRPFVIETVGRTEIELVLSVELGPLSSHYISQPPRKGTCTNYSSSSPISFFPLLFASPSFISLYLIPFSIRLFNCLCFIFLFYYPFFFHPLILNVFSFLISFFSISVLSFF